MKVAIASDHGGFEQKQELVSFIAQLGHEAADLGPADDGSVDYPEYAARVAHAVAEGRAERGVLICGTGIGMAIAANKVSGIRAANVTAPEFAVLAREHNDANVITLSGRFIDLATNREILATFLNTPFAAGRHARRITQIAELEEHEGRF
jgi:ribose 5-phosphate isomerase B